MASIQRKNIYEEESVRKIKGGDPLWSKSPSGQMIYGKEEFGKETKEKYQKNNLNERLEKKG